MKKERNKEVLSLEEVTRRIDNNEVEFVTICFPHTTQVYYKRIEANNFLKDIIPNGVKLPEIMWQLSVVNDVLQNKNYNYDNLVDITLTIDVEAGFRVMSWLGKSHVICFADAKEVDNVTPHNMYARNILKTMLSKIEEKHGITFKHAPELEYYLFNTKLIEIEKKYPAFDLKDYKFSHKYSDYFMGTTMDRYEDLNIQIKRNLTKAGIEIEGLFSEHGPGQQEINVKYDDVMFNADNHVLLKQCIKHTAYLNNYGASFMAKVFEDKDGSSGHVHISAYNKEGESIFTPSPDISENYTIEVNSTRKIQCNKQLMYFVGGLCKYIHEMFLLFAPNVNSYKRYKVDSFAPIHCNTWGYDQRTCGIRVVGEGSNLHLEVRFPGSDTNAYLLLVAVIGAGMEGVERKIDPPPMKQGNCYDLLNDKSLIRAPFTLLESVQRFEKSDLCKRLLGDKMFEYLIQLGKFEWDHYNNHISNYEVHRYLDLV